MATINSATVDILQLPTEIQLNAFSRLTAKEMQRSRRVCKHFRALVDNHHNHPILLSPGVDRSLATLRRAVDYLPGYLAKRTSGSDFLEALSRVVSSRGLWTKSTRVSQITVVMLSADPQLVDLMSRDIGFGTSKVLHHLLVMTGSLLEIHQIHHMPDSNLDLSFGRGFHASSTADEFCDKLYQPEFEEYGFTEAAFKMWYNELVNTPGGRFPVIQGPAPQSACPNYPVTNLAVWNQGHLDSSPKDVGLLVSNARLSRQLFSGALPEFRSTMWAYCVRTQWASDTIKQALEGGRITPLERAAVLEEMYLS